MKRSEWISVNEKLPKIGVPVLVTDKQGNVCIRAITCKINGKKRWSQGKSDITHWMPLPNPPEQLKEETDDE